MEFGGSYSRELEAVRRMISSSAFPAPGNHAGGGKYREAVQYGVGHDGREISGAGGEEQRDRSATLKSLTSHAIFLLQRKKKRGYQGLYNNSQDL